MEKQKNETKVSGRGRFSRIDKRIWKLFDDRILFEKELVKCSKDISCFDLFTSSYGDGKIILPLSVFRQLKKQIQQFRLDIALSSTLAVVPEPGLFSKSLKVEENYKFIRYYETVREECYGEQIYVGPMFGGGGPGYYKREKYYIYRIENKITELAKGRIRVNIPDELVGKEAKPFFVDTSIGYTFVWSRPKCVLDETYNGLSFSITLSPLVSDITFDEGLIKREKNPNVYPVYIDPGSSEWKLFGPLLPRIVQKDKRYSGVYVLPNDFTRFSNKIIEEDFLVVDFLNA